MSKLLSAGFRRLWRSRIFWIELIVMAVIPAWLGISNADYLNEGIKREFYLEDLVFSMVPAVGFVFAAAIALFLSTEYSEGALKNKIIVGHGRTEIYLANLVVCVSASLISLMVYFAVAVGLGAVLIGWFNRDTAEIASYFLISVLASAAMSALFVLVVMSVQNKATATVLAIVVFLLLTISGAGLVDRLDEPELQYGYMSVTEDGMSEFHELEENPLYVSGRARTMLELARDFNPAAQVIQVNNFDCDYPLRLPFMALIFGSLSTLAGVVVLKKKDIQ